METLTNQIAVAIENARLYQEVQQTTSELQTIFRALPDLFLRLDVLGIILNYQAGSANARFSPQLAPAYPSALR
jgi:GAF domain-containing protein